VGCAGLEDDRVETIEFPGWYEDARGRETITWRRGRWDRADGPPGFDHRTEIRGVECRGVDFDGLEPVDEVAAGAAGLSLNRYGELESCVLVGDLPCDIQLGGQLVPHVVAFRLVLPEWGTAVPGDRPLHLTATVAGDRYEAVGDFFETALDRLRSTLPDGARLVCCFTCLFSDYWPGGSGLMGMQCHRGAKEQYLAVRSKRDYWPVPVAETVPETYRCPEYQVRVPGTGYRG
jgi:Family of unknown function (DUF6304)